MRATRDRKLPAALKIAEAFLPDSPRPIEDKQLQLDVGGTAAQVEKDIEFRSGWWLPFATY